MLRRRGARPQDRAGPGPPASGLAGRSAPARRNRRVRTVQSRHHLHGLFGRDAIDRILPFDLVPRVLTAAEWDHIDRGVRQRVAALNAFLWDIYHDRAILRDKVVPESLVLGNANYRPEMVGLDVPHRHLRPCLRHRYRARRNRRLPGAGGQCAHAVRRLLRRREPPHDGAHVPRSDRRHRGAAASTITGCACTRALTEIAPSGDADPQVVLLSPGIYNSAYFEHVFLAREMGVPLVEGRDLIVEDGRVWMRTTAGLAPVHTIYRRLNDDFLDPDVFNPDSMLGVRGLIDVWRRGGWRSPTRSAPASPTTRRSTPTCRVSSVTIWRRTRSCRTCETQYLRRSRTGWPTRSIIWTNWWSSRSANPAATASSSARARPPRSARNFARNCGGPLWSLVRTPDADGYAAVQLGYRRGRSAQGEQARGGPLHEGVDLPRRYLVELRTDNASDYTLGQEVTAETFAPGELVDVTARSKGKGFRRAS